MTTSVNGSINITQFLITDPSTWIPTFGLWGGPNFSNGQRNIAYTAADIPMLLSEPVAETLGADGQWRPSPIDKLFQTHDINYIAANGQPNQAALTLQADLILEQSLANLNWADLNSVETTYAVMAGIAFEGKIAIVDTVGAVYEEAKNSLENIFSNSGQNSSDMSYTDSNGNHISSNTDANGNILLSSVQNGTVENYTINSNGNPSEYQISYTSGTIDTEYYDSTTRKLTQENITNSDGSFSATFYDQDGVTKLISDVYNAAGQIVKEIVNPNIILSKFEMVTANALATQIIAQFLFKDKLPASAVAQAFSNTVLQTAFDTGAINSTTKLNFTKLTTSQQFLANYGISLANIAASISGSTAGSELFKELGLPPQIGSIAGGVLSQQLVDQIINNVATNNIVGVAKGANSALDALSLESAFANAGGAAIGNYLGADLSKLVIGSPTQGSTFGGAVGSSIGTYYGVGAAEGFAAAEGISLSSSAVLGVIIPGIGGLIGAALGSFLGSLIGNLFGPGQSVGPNASAAIYYNTTTKIFSAIVKADNGGDKTIPTDMGDAATKELNAIMKAIGGQVVASSIPSTGIALGYYAKTMTFFAYFKPNDDKINIFSTPNAAIDNFVLRTLHFETIQGGDPLMEYALAHSTATTVAGLISDLNAAHDYGLYLANPTAFNVSLALANDQTKLSTWLSEMATAQAMGLDTAPNSGDMKGTVLYESVSYITSHLEILYDFVTSNKITTIELTDTGTPKINLTAAQAVQYSPILSKISDYCRVAVIDNFANVATNYFALKIVASNNLITGGIAFTDSDVSKFSGINNGTVFYMPRFKITNGTKGNDVLTATVSGVTLSGNGGNDTYNVNPTIGDVLIKNNVIGHIGKLNISATLSDSSFIVVGNDLVILVGTQKTIIQNWYSTSNKDNELNSINQYSNNTPNKFTIGGHFIQSIHKSTYSPDVYYGGTAQLANDAGILAQLSGKFSITFTDTAANVASNIDAIEALYAQGRLSAINLTDSGVPNLKLSLLQIANDAGALAKISKVYTTTVSDSAVYISAKIDDLQTLALKGGIAAINITDTGTPSLTLSVAQLNDLAALAKITNAYNIILHDSDANIMANLDAINTLSVNGKLSSITLTDYGIPNIQITSTQLTTYLSALSKLNGNANLILSDTVTDFVLNTDNINLTIGDNSSLSVFGKNHTITLATGDTIKINGVGDTINASGDTIFINSGSNSTNLNGDNNTVTVDVNETLNINGNGNIINAASGDSIILSPNSQVTINGSGLTITAITGDDITLNGSNNNIVGSGAYNLTVNGINKGIGNNYGTYGFAVDNPHILAAQALHETEHQYSQDFEQHETQLPGFILDNFMQQPTSSFFM